MSEPAVAPATAAATAETPLQCLVVPSHWRCMEFISDIHLNIDKPRTAEAFFQRLASSPADAIALLGDLFDAWIGDDILDEAGFERHCVEQLRAVSRQRALYFLPGNRDFLIGQRFLADSGCQRLDDPCLLEAWGQRVLLTHGDAWCLGDRPYQAFRAQVRSPDWQRALLARPLSERRALARQIREASEQRKSDQGPADYVDVDEAQASQWLARTGARTLIHGHTHHPSSASYATGVATRHVLSDWEADERPCRGDVLRWTAQGIERMQVFAPSC